MFHMLSQHRAPWASHMPYVALCTAFFFDAFVSIIFNLLILVKNVNGFGGMVVFDKNIKEGQVPYH